MFVVSGLNNFDSLTAKLLREHYILNLFRKLGLHVDSNYFDVIDSDSLVIFSVTLVLLPITSTMRTYVSATRDEGTFSSVPFLCVPTAVWTLSDETTPSGAMMSINQSILLLYGSHMVGLNKFRNGVHPPYPSPHSPRGTWIILLPTVVHGSSHSRSEIKSHLLGRVLSGRSKRKVQRTLIHSDPSARRCLRPWRHQAARRGII